MAISVKCPECQAKLRFEDDEAGEKVECSRCGATFTAPEDAEPAAPASRRKPAAADDDDDDDRPSRSRTASGSAARRRRDDDDDDDDDEDRRPRRRRSKKAAGGSSGTVLAVIGVVLFVIIGVAAGVWAFTRNKDTASRSTAPAIGGPGVPGGGRGNQWSDNAGKIEGTRWSSKRGWVKGIDVPAGTLKLEFTADGRLRYDTTVGVFTGTYTLEAGDKVVLNLDRPLAGSRWHEQRVVINGNTLTMSDTDGTTLDFEKVR